MGPASSQGSHKRWAESVLTLEVIMEAEVGVMHFEGEGRGFEPRNAMQVASRSWGEVVELPREIQPANTFALDFHPPE